MMKVDTIFYIGMLAAGASFDYDKGYYGAVVLSFFKTSDSLTGAGRKKRGIEEKRRRKIE